jgi:peptidyl-prolyl cis-trans isomerase B (cyclophilin B)
MKKLLILFFTLNAILLTATGCFFPDMPRIRNPVWDYDYSRMNLVQLEPPREGQQIVTIYTTYGEITAMLFPEYAPNTVANFIARIENGFYDGKPVLTIVENEFLFSGAYDEEGLQGMTNDGMLIENEYSVNLWPFKGSLLSFAGRQGYGDSRFLMLGGVSLDEVSAGEMRNTVRSDGTALYPEELIQAFLDNKSLPGAIGLHTIFGQVIDGFDILDELLIAPTDEETKKPLEKILIEKIELSIYTS